MVSTGVGWNGVLAGATLVLANTGGPLGFTNVTIELDQGDSTKQLFDGVLDGTKTITLNVGFYTVQWTIIAINDSDGLSGAAGFSADVVNADGSINGTPITASCSPLPPSTSAAESGGFDVAVISS